MRPEIYFVEPVLVDERKEIILNAARKRGTIFDNRELQSCRKRILNGLIYFFQSHNNFGQIDRFPFYVCQYTIHLY